MSDSEKDFLTEVEGATEKALDKVLAKYGLDVEDPKEEQADRLFLRRLRKDTEDMRGHVRRGLVGSLLTGLLVLLVVGGQEYFKK